MASQVTLLPAIDEAATTLGLNFKQVAQVIRADESTLHRWRKGEKEPSPVFLARLEALDEFVATLKSTVQPGYIRAWLNTPVPALEGKTPRSLLLEGQIEKLTGLLIALNSGLSL
jgi:hypothetical protein